MINLETILIGYSGHSYVVADAIYSSGGMIKGYCDNKVKSVNPFDLEYLGQEKDSLLKENNWIVAIGDNQIREKIILQFRNFDTLQSVIHKSCVLGVKSVVGKGTFMAANVVINPLAKIGTGCIINTGAIIEHECIIDDFAHIAPGAVLAGNVKVGKRSFIGANSVVKQGVIIGNDVIIGAGSVVLKDVIDGRTMVGNPAKRLQR